MVRRRVVRLAVLGAIACALPALLGASSPAFAQTAAPDPIERHPDAVPGQYLVRLRDQLGGLVPDSATRLAQQFGGDVFDVYTDAVQGFAIRMSDDAARALAEVPIVEAVEEDAVVNATATQTSAPWGLDRIDQTNLPLNGTYNYDANGSKVHVYVIDSGVRTSHNEFGGRATSGTDLVDNDADASDCNGHGTHVAGSIGGSTYGVAKGVSIIAVRALDCNAAGTLSSVVGGVDWVTSNAIKPAVANMSIGGSTSTTLDNAVRNSIASGVVYTVAAGNNSGDACNGSPARVAEAITVAATDQSDARFSQSNFGSCVDLFAPGVDIQSATNSSDSATLNRSGTSMASAHTAGAAAVYLDAHPCSTPGDVALGLAILATTDHVTNAGSGSPNRLLSTQGVGPAAPPCGTSANPPDAPTLWASGANSLVHLTWTTPADGGSPLTGFAIYRGTSPGGEAPSPIATVGAGATTFDDGTAANGTTYYYAVAAVNAVGQTRSPEASATPLTSQGAYFPLVPARLLDTREGNGAPLAQVGPNSSIDLQVNGRGGVPAGGVSAVVMNVTVTNPSAATYITVWPTGVNRPLASNLNVDPGETIPNLVTVKVGAGGRVSLYNAGASIDLVADVVGYYADGSTPSESGARYHSIVPARILDSRDGTGLSGPWSGNQSRDLQVAGVGGVPGDATAVVLNLTATNTTARSFVTAWPAGVARPWASNLNFEAGQTIPNLVIVQVGFLNQRVSLYNFNGSVQLVADVVGYFNYGDTAGATRFTPVVPERELDSRDGTGLSGPWNGNEARNLTVAGVHGIPGGAQAVVLNVTVVTPTAAGYVTVWPAGVTRPLASNLNFVSGDTIPNLVMVQVGAAQQVGFYNAAGSTHLVADVVGYFG